MKFRPAAVPLITVDPFLSVWACADALGNNATQHWSGKDNPIYTGVVIKGKLQPFSAVNGDGLTVRHSVPQTSLKVTPTSSIYTFENNEFKATLTFTTPLLLDKLDIMTRPVSYVEYNIEPKSDDVKPEFIFGICSNWSVNNNKQEVAFKKTGYSVCCGNIVQMPLSHSGDNVSIDWGYLHLCDPSAYITEPPAGRAEPQKLQYTRTYNAYNEKPYIVVKKKELSGVIMVAYDEIKPIEYFGTQLDEYYTKYFDSFEAMVKVAKSEYPEIKKLCREFDEKLLSETEKFGKNYQNIVSLAYRQAVGAHKLVEDTEGNILFLSKECDSNGCIGTLDVTYPSIPLFLKYNPQLVKGMLHPILKFAKSDEWTYEYTPHDVGTYPIANGQTYIIHGEYGQMPVEEAGNMLLCLAAVEKYSGGDKELFNENKELIKRWADYLVKYGYDPENQLCTDDFAGHLGHNCNLSLKAILGIAAYSSLSGDGTYMEIAKKYAKNWEKNAIASHGATRLAFDRDDTWSIKYNIIWDNLLDYKLFSDDIKNNEIKYYTEKMNRYGVPLDCREDYTKIDWLMWSTRITDDKEYFDKVCQCIVNMINETGDRVPLTDWYYTSTATYVAFRNRTVVGGLFVNLL